MTSLQKDPLETLPEKPKKSVFEQPRFQQYLFGTILCVAGVAGMGCGVKDAGWLIFFGALILLP